MDGPSNAGRVALCPVEGSKTTDLPGGNATLAFKKLREKYVPQSDPSYVSLNKLFVHSELKVNKKPEIFLPNSKMLLFA